MRENASQGPERRFFSFRDRRFGRLLAYEPGGSARPRTTRQLDPHASSSLERQLGLAPEALQIPLASAFVVAEHDRLCLFNVLVALEWTPSAATLAELRSTFDAAADLLFDVTDGLMTFGQVLVGGPELMEHADIQIFASTRLFPRSAVSGLLDERKYQPIRLGRGLWSKQAEQLLPWSAAPGPATLVHEWAHYALGLKDQYLVHDRAHGIVFPRNSPVEHTLMASLEMSELLATPAYPPRPGCDDSEWAFLSHNPAYAALRIQAHGHPRQQPEPLVPLPAFHVLAGARGQAQEARLALPDRLVGGRRLRAGRCWAYIIKGAGRELLGAQALLAQGSLGDGQGVLELCGVESGDTVALQSLDDAERPIVAAGQVARLENGNAQVDEWRDATPASPQLLDVTVTSSSVAPPYRVRIDGALPGHGLLFPLGQRSQDGTRAEVLPADRPGDLCVLDGHLLHVDGQGGLTIASYSVGGSPGSGYPAHPNPIPAGSSDGNAMLFFYDARHECLSAAAAYGGQAPDSDAEHVRIVVSTSVTSAMPVPEGLSPRSYTFGVTSNVSFATLNQGDPAVLSPTLVLYYDRAALDAGAAQLLLCRWERGSWAPLAHPARQLADKWFVAAPLDAANAPGLYAESPAAEHFRLFVQVAKQG
jgi:hypothetical protein